MLKVGSYLSKKHTRTKIADKRDVFTGAWLIHIVLILVLKILYDIIPSISQETSWTLVNATYDGATYLMFHYVRGIPFEFNAGAYDNLNMWEQIDDEDQYTPTKKFLLSVPICLFLVSTHYTHYDLVLFVVNFLATLAVVVPKLPAVSLHLRSPLSLLWVTFVNVSFQLHRMRFTFFNPEPEHLERDR